MFKNILVIWFFSYAIISINQQIAESIYCYTCTSYMDACRDPIDTSRLQYQKEPCSTSCFTKTLADGTIVRGCAIGQNIDPYAVGTVTDTNGIVYSLCNTETCNGGSGTVVQSTSSQTQTTAKSITSSSSSCAADFCKNFGTLVQTNPCICDCPLLPYSGSDCSIVNCNSEDPACPQADCNDQISALMCPITCGNPACYPSPTSPTLTSPITTACPTDFCKNLGTLKSATAPCQCDCPLPPYSGNDCSIVNCDSEDPACPQADCNDQISALMCPITCGNPACKASTIPTQSTTVTIPTQPTTFMTPTQSTTVTIPTQPTTFMTPTQSTTVTIPTQPTTITAQTTTPACSDSILCQNAAISDCSALFTRTTCKVLCGTCFTTTFTTTTTTTTTTTDPCFDSDPYCDIALPSDCQQSSFVKRICPKKCNTCDSISTQTSSFTTPTQTTTFTIPTQTASFTISTPTATFLSSTIITTSTQCVPLNCKNNANFNGVSCKCECIPGTYGTLCELLDCNFDSLGSVDCAAYAENYGLCSYPDQAILCIATCGLCDSSTPVSETTLTTISTTTTGKCGNACKNGGTMDQNTCLCECFDNWSGGDCSSFNFANLSNMVDPINCDQADCSQEYYQGLCPLTCLVCPKTPQIVCENGGTLQYKNPNGEICKCDCSSIVKPDNTPRYTGDRCEIDTGACKDEPTCGTQFPSSACGLSVVQAYCPVMCNTSC